MTNPVRNRAVLVALLVPLATFAACSSDEAPPPPLPEGPPNLGIVSLEAPGMSVTPDAGGCFAIGERFTGGAASFVVILKTDKSGQIPLLLPDGSQPRFWTFQPPRGCSNAPDCGFALLLVDPETAPCDPKPKAPLSIVSAGPSISVPFEDLRRSLGDRTGSTKLRVEFWPGEGVPDPKHCRFAEATFDFEQSCGPSDAGADGASDAAGDASSDATDAHGDGAPSDGASADGARDGAPPEAASGDGALPDATSGRDATGSDGAGPSDSAPDGPG